MKQNKIAEILKEVEKWYEKKYPSKKEVAKKTIKLTAQNIFQDFEDYSYKVKSSDSRKIYIGLFTRLKKKYGVLNGK